MAQVIQQLSIFGILLIGSLMKNYPITRPFRSTICGGSIFGILGMKTVPQLPRHAKAFIGIYCSLPYVYPKQQQNSDVSAQSLLMNVVLFVTLQHPSIFKNTEF